MGYAETGFEVAQTVNDTAATIVAGKLAGPAGIAAVKSLTNARDGLQGKNNAYSATYDIATGRADLGDAGQILTTAVDFIPGGKGAGKAVGAASDVVNGNTVNVAVNLAKKAFGKGGGQVAKEVVEEIAEEVVEETAEIIVKKGVQAGAKKAATGKASAEINETVATVATQTYETKPEAPQRENPGNISDKELLAAVGGLSNQKVEHKNTNATVGNADKQSVLKSESKLIEQQSSAGIA